MGIILFCQSEIITSRQLLPFMTRVSEGVTQQITINTGKVNAKVVKIC